MQPSMDGRQQAPSSREHSCVVLLPPLADAAPEELVHALAKRGLRATTAWSCYRAMAELAVNASFDEAMDSAAGRGGALIVVEPASQPEQLLDDLVGSMRTFLPGSALWAYEASAEPRLHRYDRPAPEPDIVVKAEAARRAAAARRNGSHLGVSPAEPSLRLRRDEEEATPASPVSDSVEDGADDHAGGAGLLSPEELSMLLAEDDQREEQA